MLIIKMIKFLANNNQIFYKEKKIEWMDFFLFLNISEKKQWFIEQEDECRYWKKNTHKNFIIYSYIVNNNWYFFTSQQNYTQISILLN